jgi:hypothetical protein
LNRTAFFEPVCKHMGRLAAFEPGLLVATLSPDPVLAHDPLHTLLAAPFPAADF